MSEDRDPLLQPENPPASPASQSVPPASQSAPPAPQFASPAPQSARPAELTPPFPPASPPVVPLGRTGEWFPVQLGYPFPGQPSVFAPPPPPAAPNSRTGLVITILIGLVGITGLVLGVVMYNDGSPGSKHAAKADGKVTQSVMCQTIAVASDGDGPSAIPTMPGGEEDLSAMQVAEAQVYQWAEQTETGPLKSELEQENADAEQFIADFNADPQDDSITPTGVLSIDMSTFTIDQAKVDDTCGINVTGSKGLSA